MKAKQKKSLLEWLVLHRSVVADSGLNDAVPSSSLTDSPIVTLVSWFE